MDGLHRPPRLVLSLATKIVGVLAGREVDPGEQTQHAEEMKADKVACLVSRDNDHTRAKSSYQ